MDSRYIFLFPSTETADFLDRKRKKPPQNAFLAEEQVICLPSEIGLPAKSANCPSVWGWGSVSFILYLLSQ